MKIKKCIGLLLAAVLTGGMLSGCGNSNTVSIVNVSYTPPESCIPNIIRFLQSIGKNRPDRMWK